MPLFVVSSLPSLPRLYRILPRLRQGEVTRQAAPIRGNREQATAGKAMQHVMDNGGCADRQFALDLPL